MCHKIVNTIEEIKKDIKENRSEYLDTHKFLSLRSNQMTELERSSWIRKTKKRVEILLLQVKKFKTKERKMKNKHITEHEESSLAYLLTKTSKLGLEVTDLMREKESQSKETNVVPIKDVNLEALQNLDVEENENNFNLDLNKSEMQELKFENQKLFNSLSESDEQAINMQQKAVSIASMMKQFGELVVEQHGQLNRIDNNYDDAQINMDAGLKHLEQAAENQVSNRFAILSILMILTFSLLFLDWFNP